MCAYTRSPFYRYKRNARTDYAALVPKQKMFISKLAVVIVLYVWKGTYIEGNGWTYGDQEAWKTDPMYTCAGDRQSPITISACPGNAQEGESLVKIELDRSQIEVPISGTIKNDGHTVEFTPDQKDIVWRNHLGTYAIHRFHFHWGKDNYEGSEHTIDGRKYPMEIHFVSAKQELPVHSTTTEGDAYSVLGVMCETDSLISGGVWDDLRIPGTYRETFTVTLTGGYAQLIPSNLDYYHYEGSLTTPPCSEVVQWFVVQTPIRCPKSFVESLRLVDDRHGHNIEYNFRDIQPIGSRTVAAYTDEKRVNSRV